MIVLLLLAAGLSCAATGPRAATAHTARSPRRSQKRGQESTFTTTVTALRRSALLSNVPDADFAPLARSARAETFSKGALVIDAASERPLVFAVASGTARVSRSSSQGRRLAFGELREGDIYGLSFLGVAEPPGNQVEATSSALHVYYLPLALLEELLARNGNLCLRALHLVNQGVSQVCDRTAALAFDSMRVRLAHELARTACARQGRLVVRRTRDELARWVGTRPEEVSRVIRQFEREGLIRIIPYHTEIEVLDRDALAGYE